MRPIDADALADEMMKSSMPSHDIGGRYQTGFMDARSMVISAPTIDSAKRGEWKVCCYQNKKCSECGYIIGDDDAEEFRFCPNCGAYMRGE